MCIPRQAFIIAGQMGATRRDCIPAFLQSCETDRDVQTLGYEPELLLDHVASIYTSGLQPVGTKA